MADDDDERGHPGSRSTMSANGGGVHRLTVGPWALSYAWHARCGRRRVTQNENSRIRRALVEDLRLGDATSARSWQGSFGVPLCGPPVAHSGIEIAWVRSGRAEYRLDAGRPFFVGSGELVIVPAGTEHATSFSGDLAAGALELADDTARAITETVGDARALRAGIVIDIGDVRGLVGAIDEEIHTPGPGRDFAVAALAEALLVRVLRRRGERANGPSSRPRDPRIRRALDYLDAHASDAIEVADLARAAGMSRFHFSRVFRDETGSSPYAYLVDRRLDRVACRLRAGDVSVTMAALDAGFRDLGRFGRAFKARFGTTASAYARDFISSTRSSSDRTRASI
jgi:AraC-like DNA-binding protein/mannose-6-phosphate isomerase-like protein (cupin superfamily)